MSKMRIHESVEFSVLICTYNRPELLGRSLEALIERTEEKPGEVIIVNGGNENAERVVNSFKGRHGIQIDLIKTVNKNLAVSRNTGLPHCKGAIVAMTDDDAEVLPDWISQMKRSHQAHPEAGAVGGLVLAIDRSTLASRLSEKVTFPSWSKPRYVRTLPTVNLSYKRKVIESLGSQDEDLWTGEEVDYNWRLLKAGYKILFDPLIRVYHHNPTTLRDLWFKHFTYGRGYYLLRTKWKDMHCIYPHQFQTLKDLLKLANFFAASLYEPFQTAVSMERLTDKVMALPIQFINHWMWRYGMLVQARRQKTGILGR